MADPCLEEMTTESQPFNHDKLRGRLQDDDYHLMKAAFSACGRGRPPNVSPLPLTNKLLLQLDSLRHELRKSWNDVIAFLPRVTDPDLLQGLVLKNEIVAAKKKATSCLTEGTDEDLDTFLAFDVGLSIASRGVGPYLMKHHILRKHLLNPELLKELSPPEELNHGMIINLATFFKKERTPLVSFRNILEILGANVTDLSDVQLSSRLKKMVHRYQSLQSSSKRPNGQENMERFLSSIADFGKLIVQEPVQKPACFPTEQQLKLANAQKTAAALRRQLEETENKLAEEKEKNRVLRESAVSHFKELQHMATDLEKAKTENAALQSNIDLVSQQLKDARQTVKDIRATNKYKCLKRKELKLEKKQAAIAAHENGQCAAKERRLKRKIKLEQTRVSNIQKQLASLRAKLNSKGSE